MSQYFYARHVSGACTGTKNIIPRVESVRSIIFIHSLATLDYENEGFASRARGILGRKGFGVGRVSPAYEQLVYAHCGREDTLRKRLELSHVRDQLRQVIVYNSETFRLTTSGIDLLLFKRQDTELKIFTEMLGSTSSFLLCESNNR